MSFFAGRIIHKREDTYLWRDGLATKTKDYEHNRFHAVTFNRARLFRLS